MTDIFSSSISPPPSSSSAVLVSRASTRVLPDELIQQVTIYLEEELYTQAITLLSNLLASGTSSNGPIFIPPPFHLSFLLTLSLHPRFTIHAATEERLRISAVATSYLSALLKAVGPVSAGFSQAYAFNNHAYMRGGRKKISQGILESSDDSGNEPLISDLAQAQGFFKRADDLWSAFGWAFTCSVLYPRRWESWRLWCSHFLDLLEQDWRLRESQDGKTDGEWPRKTLLAKYVGDSSATKVKRIIRAIFADGSGSEFTEIWKDETIRKRKKAPNLVKPVTIDIEAGILGDYAAQSSSEEDISSDNDPESKPPDSSLGDASALEFRSRLMALLCNFSLHDPHNFTSLSVLFQEYLSHIRPLSLHTFHAFLTPINISRLHPELSSTLIRHLACSYREPSGPTDPMDDLSWTVIAKYYAPFASTGQTGASTVGDNGKLGVCVELLVSLGRANLGFSPLRGVRLHDVSMRAEKADDISQQKQQQRQLWKSFEDGCAKRLARAGGNVRRAKKGEAGSEVDFETARDLESAFLKGARLRLALLLGMGI